MARHGRSAPHRFEIEPARIGPILPETFILERINQQTFRFRLAGTRLCEQFHQEFRGRNFLDLWDDSDRITLERQFSSMCHDCAVMMLTFEAVNGAGASTTFETVIFPLLHGQTNVSRALGAMSAAERPLWLGRDPVVALRLSAHELLWPDGRQRPLPRDLLQQAPLNHGSSRLVQQDRRAFRVYEGGLSKPKS